MNLLLGVVTLAACAIGSLRWLRVAQREHYLPTTTRFAARWWRSSPANLALALGGLATALVVPVFPLALVVVAAIVAAGPLGLGLTGRTSNLAWTGRMRATAGVLAGVVGLAVVGFVLAGLPAGLALTLVALPALVDLALLLWAPIQRRTDQQWVDRARDGLERSGARVVAITGSYGKTTTKGYLAHLLAGSASVMASPASFNNRMGLARAVNEQLAPGTEIFVAEMGTYGPGEIAELCRWIPPEVAVLTALGPVHLERMRTLERIASAKQEIFSVAEVGVIWVDHPLLAAVAAEEGVRRRMIRVSATDPQAEVFVDAGTGVITADGVDVGRVDPDAIQVSNAGCAVGAAIALGLEPASLAERLATLPTPPHRQVVAASERGFSVIDDTFNANPAGADRALGLLDGLDAGRRVVVTPGMVELGRLQAEANRDFAQRAATVADDLVIVGATNRVALAGGAQAGGGASVHFVATRDEAVEWVRANLGPGDAVLYENDLPDHYP